ncbi:MAG TPA: hypothetical protein VLA92_00780 [Candidatus Saccharimonadales bacterium]|nr:hypothetical protein [Candidatus Saccharimonadales bacterium]
MQETLQPFNPANLAPSIEELERQSVLPAFEAGRTMVAMSVETHESFVRPPEAEVRAVATEMWQNASPFKTENVSYFGGELERMEAAETVVGIADQARLTGKFLDGNHKALARKLDAGEITKMEHDEAVGGILTGLALTNPAHLRAVEAAQQKAIDRRIKAGVLPEDTQFVRLTSYATEDGVKLAGIDKVVASMTGRGSQAEVAAHGLEMKAQYYRPENMVKANARHQKHQAELFREALAAEEERRFVIEMLDIEDRTKKSKKDDKHTLAA